MATGRCREAGEREMGTPETKKDRKLHKLLVVEKCVFKWKLKSYPNVSISTRLATAYRSPQRKEPSFVFGWEYDR